MHFPRIVLGGLALAPGHSDIGPGGPYLIDSGKEKREMEEENQDRPSASAGRSREEHNAVAAMTSPWIEKYRPDTLQDLIAHQDIVETGEILLSVFTG